MSLKVIGAGFGRTGTLSLKIALEQLGFGKCYHMMELIQDPSTVGEWEHALKGKPTDWDRIFHGYQSAVDFPVSAYYKELMEQYPEAKIILTVRDPERWYESAISTILTFRPSFSMVWPLLLKLPFSSKARQLMRLGRHNVTLINKKIFKNKVKDKKHTIAVFNEHNKAVQSAVPREQLLVFEVKQGWEPLCQFLGVPVPDTPFPRSNKKEDFSFWAKRLFKV